MNNRYIILLCLVVMSCSHGETNQQSETTEQPIQNLLTLSAEQETNAQLSIDTLQEAAREMTIEVNGMTIANPEAMQVISSTLSGIVRGLHWNVGDRIEAGQVIGSIESTELIELQRQYLNAKAEVVFLEADAERQLKLAAEKASSERVLQETQMKLNSRRADLRAYEKNLELIGISPKNIQPQSMVSSMEIRSRTSGEVREVFVENGQFIQGNNQWLSMSSTNNAQFELLLPSYQKELIRAGMSLRTTHIGGLPSQATAIVTSIANVANADNLFPVICSPQAGTVIPAIGVQISAEIKVNAVHGFILPSDAIVQWENKNFLFVPKENHSYLMCAVNVLNAREDSTVIEINSEINDQRYVSRNAYTLLMALKNTGEE